MRKPGSRARLLSVAICLALFCLSGASGLAAAGAYGVIAGTIFQEDGRILRGAEIRVTPDAEGGGGATVKTLTAVSDARGEFAVRVPSDPMRYIVKVRAAGFQDGQETVTMGLEGRVDVNFRLEAAKK